MTPITWQQGTLYYLFAVRYLIVGRNSSTSVLAQGPDGHHKVFPIKDLVNWLERGDLVLDYQPDPPGTPPPRSLAALPEPAKQAARKRLEIIRPLCEMETVPRNMLAATARAHDLSIRTLYRYLRVFRTAGFRGLVPQWLYTTAREPSVRNKAQQAIIDEVLAEKFLTLTAPRISHVYAMAKARCLTDGVQVPSRSAFYRYVQAIPPSTKTLHRDGTHAHDNQYLATPHLFTRQSSKFPLNLVSIDHTELDVEVVDEAERVAIGRPWLTLGFDAFSRMPWCMYITFDPPSSVSLMMAFRHGVLAKHAIDQDGTTHEWQAFGLPHTVIVDNGREFRSNYFADLCALLRTTIHYRPRRTPRFGGLIERAFGSLDLRVIHNLVGNTKTMRDVRHKSHDPKGAARLTIAELHQILTLYFTDIYPFLPHRGLQQRTPHQVWNDGLELCGFPASPSNVAEFLVEILPTETRTMSRQGIVRSHILYYHPRLRPHVGDTVTIKWDPWDLSHLYVWLPTACEWIEACTHEPESMKMTSMEHRLIKALIKQQDAPIDEASIRHAWQRIHEIQDRADRETEKVLKKRSRHRNAQALNIGRPHPPPPPAPAGSVWDGWDEDWSPPAVPGAPAL